MNTNAKKNIVSIILTVAVISLLIFSGPARAIEVNLTTPNIDISKELTKTFTIDVKVNDGEFLPILRTDVEFDNNGDTEKCQIDVNNVVTGCDFLSVESRTVSDLNSNYGYGYGYGYDTTDYGYGYGYGYQDFGYGYGYGYDERGQMGGQGYGTITYTLTVDVLKLPDTFIGNTIDVTATVYGGSQEDMALFKGTSSFGVSQSIENERPEQTKAVDITKQETITYGDIVLDIPADTLPAGVNKVIVQQVAAPAEPKTSTLKVLGKTYEFSTNLGTSTDFSGKFITITLTYTDDELTAAGITEDKIIPAYYDGTDWVAITTGIVRDTVNNKLSFTVDHFTKFTLLADTSTPTTSTSASSATTNAGLRGTPAPAVTTPKVETPAVTTPAPTAPVTPAVTPATGGLAGITGAVIGAAKNNSTVLIIIVSVVLVILVLTRVSIRNPFGRGKGKDYVPSAKYE